MADQIKKTQDEKLMENMNQGVGTQQPNTLVRQASAVSPVGNPQAKPAASGQFTNVRNFLGANVGAGQRLADTTASGVQRGVEQARGQVTQFGEKVGEAVKKEQSAFSQTEADKVRSGIKSIVNPNQALQDAVNQATQGQETTMAPEYYNRQINLFDDGAQFNQARRLVEGQTNVADIINQKTQLGSQAQRALTMAGQQVGQLGTESGRFNLLRRAVGGPQYTRGMQGLDNLLLSTEGAGTLAQAQQQSAAQVGQQGNILGSQTKQFATELSDIDTQARAISEDLKKQLTGGITDIETKEIDEQFKDVQNRLNLSNEAINALRNRDFSKLTPDQIRDIGLAGESLQTFDLNLGDYFKNNPSNVPTKSDLITDEQAKRLRALERLSGKDDTQLTKAGGKSFDDFVSKFNKDAFTKDQQGRENFYLKQVYDRLNTISDSLPNSNSNLRWQRPAGSFEDWVSSGGRATLGNAGNTAFTDANLVDSLRTGELSNVQTRSGGPSWAAGSAENSARDFLSRLLKDYKFDQRFTAPDVTKLPEIK